jgi:methionyl-tRNA formyltransferase
MNICIAGKNNIAFNCLDWLNNKYHGEFKLSVLTNKTDIGIDNWQRSLKKYAIENKIKVNRLDEVSEIENLLFVSLEYDKLINPLKFKSKKLFNLHFSLLPAYKGMYTSVHTILNNEKHSGVTLHEIDSGIDTGKIIAQKRFNITHDDTSRSLYFKFLDHGEALFKENFEKLLKGDYIAKPQEIIGSSYYPKNSLDFNKTEINLQKTAFQIKTFVRAFSFKEYQLPTYEGYKISNIDILNRNSNKRCGVILIDTKEYAELTTIDYDIRLYYLKADVCI